MPTARVTIEDTNRTIVSDVYFKIIEDIVKANRIPYSSLVVVHRDVESTLTDNRSNATLQNQANLPSTVSTKRITANITEDYNEHDLATTVTHQAGNHPIFTDAEVNVFVTPIYVMSDVSIEFEYITPSKTEATRIRDDLRIQLSQTKNINIHMVDYNILLPEVVEEFIADVHALKSRLYPETLDEYFLKNATNRIHMITDMANVSNTKIAVNETQCRIIGTYDFNSMPEKLEVDNESGNYKLTFTYKLSLDIPRAFVMKYPVMLCNRPMPTKYLQHIIDSKQKSNQEIDNKLHYNSGLQSLSYFESHRILENRVNMRLPLNIPEFDEFSLREGHKGYGIITSMLTDVNETDHKSLFNLQELDPYAFNATLLNYIKNVERSYVTQPYQSFMYFGLHQEDRHFDNSILTIDENLNISSQVPLSLFKPVRVTLSFILDINSLASHAIERLMLNTEILKIFLTKYVEMYQNFKTESSRYFVGEASFYRTLIQSINIYKLSDDHQTLHEIFEIFSVEPYLYNNLIGIIKQNYPQIYQYLIKHDIDLKTNNKLGYQYTNINNIAMRTTMSKYVVAMNKNRLQA